MSRCPVQFLKRYALTYAGAVPETVCAPPVLEKSADKNSPAVLTVGYGRAGCPSLVLPMLKDNVSVRVDFIKISLFIRPENKRNEDWFKLGAWGTIIIPIVQHRDAVAQPPSPTL